MEEGELTL